MPTGVHRRRPERFLLPQVPLVRVAGRILGTQESGQATELFLFKFPPAVGEVRAIAEHVIAPMRG